MAHGVIICIGDELVSGKVIDENAHWAAARLWPMGLDLKAMVTVGDDPQAINVALKQALETADFVLVSGGLGATEDDITAQVAADVFALPLAESRRMVRNLRYFFEAKGKTPPEGIDRLAWLPRGAEVLSKASAGFKLTAPKGQPVYFMPGVPREMHHITQKHVIPQLLDLFQPDLVRKSGELLVFGLNELEVQKTLRGIAEDLGISSLTLGYYPRFPEVAVIFSLTGDQEKKTTRDLAAVLKEAAKRLNGFVVGKDGQTLAQTTAHALATQNLTLALAESCTGGLIGHSLTEVAGSSSFFMRGYIVYSNQAKEELLGVSSQTLADHGAVSHETAREMALGAAGRAGVDLGLSVTGIAGPGGGSPEKPVGTVYFGLCHQEKVMTRGYLFSGSRDQVKLQAAHTAMDWLRRFTEDHAFLYSN
jgi:nicotinamide-nucleotide amidase